MSKVLIDVRILLIEDDADSGELLQMALSTYGAVVRLVDRGEAAVRDLETHAADVVICDLHLPDGSGLDWLPRLRAVPGLAALPAIALTGNARPVDRERSLAGGFAKHLAKPAQLADIVMSVSTLVSNPHSLQPLLARISVATRCRFTSLLRFEGDTLVSVWSHDSAQPGVDPFALGLPIAASYCILVKNAGTAITIEDARSDSRADGHPKQHELSAYAAAPVFKPNGEMYGTLCSYDVTPRVIDESAQSALLSAARELEKTL